MLEALAKRDHAHERLLREDAAERRAHRRERQGIAGERAADAADIRVYRVGVPVDHFAHALRHAVGAARNACAENFPDREHIGLEPPGPRAAAGPGADRVRLVDDEERPVLGAQCPHRVVIAGVRHHDSGVGEGGLEQAGGDIAGRQRCLEPGDVVDLDHACRQVEVHGPADIPLAGHRAAAVEGRDGLVDRAVIAPVVDDDLRAPGDFARPADRTAVGIRRGEREFPVRNIEAPRELAADPGGVRGRQHQRDALVRLIGDGLNRRLGCVTRHPARVAETEVDELVAVHVAEMGALRTVHVDRMIARPARHPAHRHAEKQRVLRLGGQLSAARVPLAECRAFALHQRGNAGLIDRFHARTIVATIVSDTPPVH